MRQYITAQNIVILLLSIAVLLILTNTCGPGREVKDHKELLEHLQQQQKELIKKDEALEKSYEARRKADSIFLIELNKKRDERKNIIDTANNDLLRELLRQ